jgi:hypothetical protein
MTRKEAQSRVEDYLVSLEEADPELDLVLLEESTMEFPHGWIFFYQSKGFVETGDERQFLLGNAPILIDRRDGSLHETGTARRTEYYIQNYMDTGDPNVEAVPAVVISGWRECADKVSATRLLNRETQLGLAHSKMCIDHALDRIPTSIQVSDFRHAERLGASLDALGWIVSIERQPPNNPCLLTGHKPCNLTPISIQSLP